MAGGSMYPAKQAAIDWIDENRERLSDFDLEIWGYAEPAWREYKSAKAYVDLLRAEGFEVEEGSGGMPTAFVAHLEQRRRAGDRLLRRIRRGPGQLARQRCPYAAPREGLHPCAAGHTDPHSMLGVGALGGILATKAAMAGIGIAGHAQVLRRAGREGLRLEARPCRQGLLRRASTPFLSYHPLERQHHHLGNAVRLLLERGLHLRVRQPGDLGRLGSSPDTSDDSAASSHIVARVPGAIDALCLMYTTTKYTKEAMFPHTGTWTLNEFVLAAGDATSDNLPPRFTQIQYSWRSPSLDVQQRIADILTNNARAAAAATGCEAYVQWVTKTRVGLANNAMADLTYRNMELVGAPSYDDEALEFCREIQRNLGLDPMEQPIPEVYTRLTPPEEYEAETRTLLPAWQKNFTSDDYVDYTWHAPTVRIYTGRPTLAPRLCLASNAPPGPTTPWVVSPD